MLQSSKDRAKALSLVFVEGFLFRWLGCAVRLGRLHAEKRQNGRGAHCQWALSHAELERYRRHGLLVAPRERPPAALPRDPKTRDEGPDQAVPETERDHGRGGHER